MACAQAYEEPFGIMSNWCYCSKCSFRWGVMGMVVVLQYCTVHDVLLRARLHVCAPSGGCDLQSHPSSAKGSCYA